MHWRRDLLQDRNTLLVVAARFISRVGGTAVFFIGVWGVAAYTYHASAKTLAFVMAGNSIASIIGSVIAGVLVDRIGPRRVLIYAELLTIPVVIALVMADSWGVFVGLAWLLGLVGTPTFTAGASFAPFLVDGVDELERVNAAVEAAGSAGFVLGPAIGAFLAKVLGLPSVFWLMAGCSVAAAALAFAVRTRDIVAAEQHHPFAEFRDGLRVAYSTRTLRYAILAGTAVWFGFGAFSALEPLFFRDVVGVGVEWIGWMNTAFSVGLITGAWLLPRLPRKLLSVRGLAVVTALCGLGGIGYVGTTDLRTIALGAAVWGLMIGVAEPLMRTVLQVASPEGYVGRVIGTAMYHRNAGELVPLAFAPALAAAFGVQATLIAGGVVVAVGVLASLPIAASIDRELAADGRSILVAHASEPHVGIGDEIL
ncbi:MAG: MFS transporter [Coriobacteriia bacterium]|nr:MFS transporter [Coriobacteriia bacterium]